MKSFRNFIITILLTIIFSLPILWVSSRVFIPKWLTSTDNRMSYIIKGFYEEPSSSLDIVFTGNSDVYRAISPMHLYDKTGITSYNFVSAGQRMWIAYPMLKEIFKTQKPKIVFFNVDEVFYTSNASIGNYHKVYDNMPLSINKLQGIFDSNYDKNIAYKLTHFFPIFLYHNRYSELTKEDFQYAFKNYNDPLKGMDLVTFNQAYESSTDYMEYSEELAAIPEKNRKYLDLIRDLCAQNDAELILLEVPSADSWNYRKHNAISAYAEENNLKFLDLNLELTTMNFDWSKDTSDGGDHLNLYGATKVTDYLADYLTTNYTLPSHKDDKSYALWQEQLEDYQEIEANAGL